MKIGLVSSLMKDNDLEHQIGQIKYYISSDHNCDLLCFGESFLQGFEGLTWDYDEDIKRALRKDDPAIIYIRELGKKYRCGLSFGFIERVGDHIYSSNMVIDSKGEIVDIFRRVSIGWKERIANSMYKEGQAFHTFTYENKTLGAAICGDLWHDNFLEELEEMEMDALLWPLYIDFPIKEWQEEYEEEYAERTQNLPYPSLMINSLAEGSKRANGGCNVFYKNEVVAFLPMGEVGILEFELK